MINYRKIISMRVIAVVLIMVLASTSVVYGAPSDWAEDFIKSMLLEELSSDELIDSDKLQQPITREEFAELTVILYAKAKNMSVDDIVQWNPFYDTDNKMVAKAYNIGIVSGTGKDDNNRMLFSPTNKVTRQEIAVMLVKELKIIGIDVKVKNELNYSDEEVVASWAYDAVAFAGENGILSGVGENRVAPTANATREQALVLLNKIAVKYGWIDNKEKDPIFNYLNSTELYGFRLPNYNVSLLRSIKTDTGIKYVISNLVDTYKPDIKKQQSDLINILVNADAVSYDAFVEIRERILESYDHISKKFKTENTVYINTTTGNVFIYEISKPYIKISVDTEFTMEYVNK